MRLSCKILGYWEFQTRDSEFQEIRVYEDGWLRWLRQREQVRNAWKELGISMQKAGEAMQKGIMALSQYGITISQIWQKNPDLTE